MGVRRGVLQSDGSHSLFEPDGVFDRIMQRLLPPSRPLERDVEEVDTNSHSRPAVRAALSFWHVEGDVVLDLLADNARVEYAPVGEDSGLDSSDSSDSSAFDAAHVRAIAVEVEDITGAAALLQTALYVCEQFVCVSVTSSHWTSMTTRG